MMATDRGDSSGVRVSGIGLERVIVRGGRAVGIVVWQLERQFLA
jgi:hypothetical protein